MYEGITISELLKRLKVTKQSLNRVLKDLINNETIILKKGKIDAREHFINKLITIPPNIKFDCYGLNEVQPIWSEDFINSISQNKIGLNLSQGKPSNFYSSDRFSQLIGNGLLVMIDDKTKIGNFFSKNEIITYKNISDLSEKILKYNKDDKIRRKIAKNGREKYFKYFNSEIIADFIINSFYLRIKHFRNDNSTRRCHYRGC